MPQMSPRGESVAVVVPVYCAQYLKECLTSIARQTRPADEVIVVDDGSPDRELIAAAAADFPRAITVLSQPNLGAAVARNVGLRHAKTALVAFLDADDYWYPAFLETQLAFLRSDSDCSVVYADADIIGDSPLSGRRFMHVTPSSGAVTLTALLLQQCTVLTSTVVARRMAIVRAGLFDHDLRRGQDFDLWLRMAHRGARFGYQTMSLAARRVHSKNLSGTITMEIERALAVLEKARRTLTLGAGDAAALDGRVQALGGILQCEAGKSRLIAGDIAGARAAFAAAARAVPGWKLTAVRLGLQIAPRLVRRVYSGGLYARVFLPGPNRDAPVAS